MRRVTLGVLALLAAAAASAGDFATNLNNNLFTDKQWGQNCPYAISAPEKCWTYQNANDVKGALIDLRADNQTLKQRIAQLEAAISGGTTPPTCSGLSPSSGLSGTSVQLTSSNNTLKGATGVTFNGFSAGAPAVSADGSTATTAVPTNATTGPVVITTPNGSSTCGTFTVSSPTSKPVVNSFTGPASVASGQTASLSYSVSGGTSCSINGISVSCSGTSYTTPAITTTTTFTLTATNSAGSTTANATISIASAPTCSGMTPVTGPAGTTVTISGNNLSTASVAFNNTSASISSNTATTIVTSVPTSATTGNVVVSTSGGSASCGTFTVTSSGTYATLAIPPWTNDGGLGNVSVSQVSGTSAVVQTGTGYHYALYQLTDSPTVNQQYQVCAKVKAGSVSTFGLELQTYGTRQARAMFSMSGAGSYSGLNDGASATISTTDNQWYTGCVTGSFTTANVQPSSGLPYFLTFYAGDYADLAAASGTAVYVQQNSITYTAGLSMPTINSFTASPSSISAGQTSTLSWNTSGATSGTIFNVGELSNPSSGSQVVSPQSTTTYQMQVCNSSGCINSFATVTVASAGTVATPTLSPPGGNYGTSQNVTISDSTPNATIHYMTDGNSPTCSTGTTCTPPCTVLVQ